ncbi:MAG: hypothetical protein QME58_14160 [Bacteroidota bacterium]|nr:hypothetical protein [Bacteroidota bacterium]
MKEIDKSKMFSSANGCRRSVVKQSLPDGNKTKSERDSTAVSLIVHSVLHKES